LIAPLGEKPQPLEFGIAGGQATVLKSHSKASSHNDFHIITLFKS